MTAQTIFRRAHLSNFVTISNALAREVTLSHRERGVLIWLLSYPVDWNVHLEALVTPDDSIRSLRRVVQRLEDAGYIKRERERDAITGRLGRTIFFVYDEPIPLTERSHDSRRKAPKTENGTQAPKTKKRTVGTTGKLTGKTPMTKNPSSGNWPTTKTEEDTKTEERETDALSELPDHLTPAQRRIIELPATNARANGDGGALAHTLIEAYCDAWNVTEQKYRDQWHRAQKRGAEQLASQGATPDEVRAIVAEKRALGKQPDQCQMKWMADDYYAWQARQSAKPVTITLTDAQKAAQEAALEAERVAWRKEQGLV